MKNGKPDWLFFRFLISFLTLFLEAMRPPGAAGLLRRGESKQLQPEVRHHLIPGHRKNLGLAPWVSLQLSTNLMLIDIKASNFLLNFDDLDDNT